MAERLSSQPTLHDGEDLEEFLLLLRSDGATALIEVARQQGLTAAGLVRRLICDYLRQTQTMLFIGNSSVARSIHDNRPG